MQTRFWVRPSCEDCAARAHLLLGEICLLICSAMGFQRDASVGFKFSDLLFQNRYGYRCCLLTLLRNFTPTLNCFGSNVCPLSLWERVGVRANIAPPSARGVAQIQHLREDGGDVVGGTQTNAAIVGKFRLWSPDRTTKVT